MRALLRPFLLPLLRQDPGGIARRAERFSIADPERRTMVQRLGRAFLGGYNAMLETGDLTRVAAEGDGIEAHYRPFWFEGAAMGYLARATIADDCPMAAVESRLIATRPGFRYLYYVGLGFWYGFRHRTRPARVAELGPHVDPLYLPLCYDGFGFKLGFFHGPDDSAVWRALTAAGEQNARWLYQGFGRSLFFVFMDDGAGFDSVRERAGAARGHDLELGRALALAFTGVDRPSALVAHLREALGTERLSPRLIGVAWGLAARRLCDPRYFDQCLARTDATDRTLLEELPRVCERARGTARSYREWQARAATGLVAALERWETASVD